ncbi:MAG: NERD domain-containing protein [Eggerthellaceae bacterium]|nr:NERD domain-containing protein [Eggerthellaceae bacterium]
MVNCICCHCGAVFNPGEVRGRYLNRACPSCNGNLAEGEYDSAAAAISDEIAEVSGLIEESKAAVEKWKTWARRFRLAIFKPINRVFQNKADTSMKRCSELSDRLTAKRRRLYALAKSRYYVSEWYQLTRIPLIRTVVEPYTINVGYGPAGKWSVSPTDSLTSGITAEIQVFMATLARIRDESSQLCEARLVPNIYLPHKQRSVRAERLWSQIDLILLTRQAAFVIEVKRRRKRVLAPAPFEEIWSTTDGSLVDAYARGVLDCASSEAGFTDESFALNQNSRHAIALSEVCKDYPFERIYEQVVYVGTDSFSTDCKGFVDNVNVSKLGRSVADFAGIIEAECARLDSIVSQSRIDDLGEELVETYGDLNQKRGQLHAERIRKMNRV